MGHKPQGAAAAAAPRCTEDLEQFGYATSSPSSSPPLRGKCSNCFPFAADVCTYPVQSTGAAINLTSCNNMRVNSHVKRRTIRKQESPDEKERKKRIDFTVVTVRLESTQNVNKMWRQEEEGEGEEEGRVAVKAFGERQPLGLFTVEAALPITQRCPSLCRKHTPAHGRGFIFAPAS